MGQGLGLLLVKAEMFVVVLHVARGGMGVEPFAK